MYRQMFIGLMELIDSPFVRGSVLLLSDCCAGAVCVRCDFDWVQTICTASVRGIPALRCVQLLGNDLYAKESVRGITAQRVCSSLGVTCLLYGVGVDEGGFERSCCTGRM